MTTFPSDLPSEPPDLVSVLTSLMSAQASVRSAQRNNEVAQTANLASNTNAGRRREVIRGKRKAERRIVRPDVDSILVDGILALAAEQPLPRDAQKHQTRAE